MMIYALEGLRGLAALIVALFHGWDSDLARIPLMENGWLFVHLFFVISGFVMAHVYGQHLNTVTDIKVFAVKRFGRLYPLHLITLFAYLGCEYILQGLKVIAGMAGKTIGMNPPAFDMFQPLSFLANLLLVHGIGMPGGRAYNPPSWSISTEIWGYLLFAASIYLVRGHRLRNVIWLALAIAGLSLWTVVPLVGDEFYSTFFRCAYGFFLGAMLPSIKANITLSATQISCFQTVVAAAVIALIWQLSAHPYIVFFMVPAFAALVLSLSYDTGPVARVLQLGSFQTLGRLSYSIYMTHEILLIFLNPVGQAIPEPYRSALKVPYIAAVLALSVLTYRFIENPWRNRFKLAADRLRARQKRSSHKTPNEITN